jgi:hypothetical protein
MHSSVSFFTQLTTRLTAYASKPAEQPLTSDADDKEGERDSEIVVFALA